VFIGPAKHKNVIII